jgi:hypothetical protein
MEQPEANQSSDESTDARLSGQLQGFHAPSSAGLEQATRQRIDQYLRQRRIEQAALVLACFVAAVGALRLMVPNEDKVPKVAHQQESQPLDDRELAALFSPPPVDPLSLLDRQQQVSYQALKQWERSR